MEADEIEGVARPLSADVQSDVPEKIETSRGAAVPGHSDATVTRMRSNNGHGCAELDDSADEAEAVGRVHGPVKDPFEVSWDGDNDPFCPRSMSKLHKWTIVLIVGLGSLCV